MFFLTRPRYMSYSFPNREILCEMEKQQDFVALEWSRQAEDKVHEDFDCRR